MDLAVSSGALTEIRDVQTGVSLGAWILPDNTSGNFAPQNCWTDAVWFFPVLGSLATGPNVVLSYVRPRNSEWNVGSAPTVISVRARAASRG